MTSAGIWQRYFFPSVTFMSVVIGGGYATGRELAEFFMPAGPLGGLLGMLVTAIVWSVVFALSLDLARATHSYDYRSFFRQLLGRGWVVFEAAYLALLVLILAVLGAACGEIVAHEMGLARWVGTVLFMLCIAMLVYSGSRVIERFFSVWGIVLYAAYVVFFSIALVAFDEPIAAAFASEESVKSGWASGGLSYASYNLVTAPALLFCARYQRQRRESLIAGALAGPIAMLPGILFFVTMLARYPDIAAAPIPLQVLLDALDSRPLAVFMQIAIFGTLVQTGIGVLHGFNERLMGQAQGEDQRERTAGVISDTRTVRLLISLGLCVVAIVLATRIGLIDLIAKGYGYLSWVILAVYVVPVLIVGTRHLVAPRRATVSAP
jgi:uncharacterized membrane protein YkvI